MLNERKGNIWDVHNHLDWVGVTTNSTVHYGRNVMGGGIAKEAKDRYKPYPGIVAEHLSNNGNTPVLVPDFHSFTFPTKHDVWKNSDLALVVLSWLALDEIIQHFPKKINWHIPRPGCGLGGLEWEGENGVGAMLDDLNMHDNVYFWSF